MKHEDVDRLVRDMEKRLRGERFHGRRMIELWETPEEGEERVTIFLCRLSDDKWRKVVVRLKNISGIKYTDGLDSSDCDLLKAP